MRGSSKAAEQKLSRNQIKDMMKKSRSGFFIDVRYGFLIEENTPGAPAEKYGKPPINLVSIY